MAGRQLMRWVPRAMKSRIMPLIRAIRNWPLISRLRGSIVERKSTATEVVPSDAKREVVLNEMEYRKLVERL